MTKYREMPREASDRSVSENTTGNSAIPRTEPGVAAFGTA